MLMLPGNYISGFVDGEGCFSLIYRKDFKRRLKKTYFEWTASFIIVSRKDDTGLLRSIKKRLGVGKIYFNQKCARFVVANLDELYSVVIPFFKKYKLHGKKSEDFKLWSEAVEILYKNKKRGSQILKGIRGFRKKFWDQSDLDKLKEIREQMKPYKSERDSFKHSPHK